MVKIMIIVVGSVNADLVSFTPRFPRIGETVSGKSFAMYQGGKGANQAVGISKLGEAVRFFGAVGDDTFGDFLLKNLENAGVDTSFVKKIGGKSGVASIWVDEKGENSIVLTAGANTYLDDEMVRSTKNLFENATYLLLQLETPLSGVIQACEMAKENGVKVILDPAPAMELPDELLGKVDYITPNEVEISLISKGDNLTDRVRWLEEKGPKVIVKAGSKGVYVSKYEALEKLDAFSVKAVDTTGAGDCFNAAFAVSLSKGMNIDKACEFAMAASAISVTRKGAAASFPTREEVETFLKRQGA
jgi:ribokinase